MTVISDVYYSICKKSRSILGYLNGVELAMLDLDSVEFIK